MIIFDIEIKKAIPIRGEERIEGIEYCRGWSDYEGMGISMIGCYDYWTNRYRVFFKDNFKEFMALMASRSLIIGFNSCRFDNMLLKAHGLAHEDLWEHTYDILREIWVSERLDPDKFSPKTHGGLGLDVVARANDLSGKTGNGAMAPVWFQRGEYGKVADYCLQDIKLTKGLLDLIMARGYLINPKDGYQMHIRRPS